MGYGGLCLVVFSPLIAIIIICLIVFVFNDKYVLDVPRTKINGDVATDNILVSLLNEFSRQQ